MALQSVENTESRAVAPPITDSSERELLDRIARSKDQAAFRSLYGNYYQRLTRLLSRMSVRREDIEEVINDTFWVVWTKAGEFRGASQLSTWIIGIAYRRALNALRRARLRPGRRAAACAGWPKAPAARWRSPRHPSTQGRTCRAGPRRTG